MHPLSKLHSNIRENDEKKATLHSSLLRGDRPVMYAMRKAPVLSVNIQAFIAVRGESDRVVIRHEENIQREIILCNKQASC